MAEPYYFMLPRLVEAGLCSDDRENYVFVTYPREVIAKGAIIVVSDYAGRLDSIRFEKKKDVKTVIEYMAVALSLKIQHHSLMNTARLMYRRWFTDPSIFGNVERQNKFLRRLIKQLSMPFEMREPDNPDVFKKEFCSLLLHILEDLNFAIEHLGSIFTYETWDTCLSVAIGIADATLHFRFGGLLPTLSAQQLKQATVDLCYNVLELSGLKNEELWSRFKEYCVKWSNDLDYIKVWGRQLLRLFVAVHARIYRFPMEYTHTGGVYSKENPMPNEMVKFLFHKVLYLIDTKKPQFEPDTLKEMALIVARLTDQASKMAEYQGEFLMRYPGKPFLKLFGRFLTGIPMMPASFDEAVAIIVDTILVISSKFDIDFDVTVPRLIAYVKSRSTSVHMEIVASFLNQANSLFSRNTTILPLVAEHSLVLISQFKRDQVLRLTDEYFSANVLSLFMSSTEILRSFKPETDIQLSAVDILWKLTDGLLPLRFQFLSYCSAASIDIVPRLVEIFTKNELSVHSQNNLGIMFIASTLILLGTVARFDAEFVGHLSDAGLVTRICELVLNIDIRRIDNYDLVVAGVLQMFLDWALYCPAVLTKSENISSILVFLDNLRPLINEYEGVKTGIPYFTVSLYKQLYAKVIVRSPNKDLFARRYGSHVEVNEESLIKEIGLVNPTIHYVTVGDYSLISFIETDNLKDPVLAVVRGVGGKMCFCVDDLKQFDSTRPRLYSLLGKEALPQLESWVVSDYQNDEERPRSHLKKTVPSGDFAAIDEKLSEQPAKDFSSWFGDKYSFRTGFTDQTPYHRPRFGDVLAGLGLLTCGNTHHIGIIRNVAHAEKAIKLFDKLDNEAIMPVGIVHLLPTDKNYHDCHVDYVPGKSSQRMTPLLLKFFREIGEPMTIDTGVVPALRSTVPVIPCCQSLVAFFTPAMGKTEEDAKKLYDIGEQASMKIIFNETDFELRYQNLEHPKQHVLIIRPTLSGLYYVRQAQCPTDILSPFPAEQLMSAKTLAFFIINCFEQSLRTNPLQTMPDLVTRRREILADLTGNECDPAIAGKVSCQVLD